MAKVLNMIILLMQRAMAGDEAAGFTLLGIVCIVLVVLFVAMNIKALHDQKKTHRQQR